MSPVKAFPDRYTPSFRPTNYPTFEDTAGLNIFAKRSGGTVFTMSARFDLLQDLFCNR